MSRTLLSSLVFRVMDVLEPELIWVDGQCYRFYEKSVWKNIHTSAPYMEDKESENYSEEELSGIDIEIKTYDAYFKHSFRVPKAFYPFIIGTKGATLKKLESETKATIDVPRKKKDGDIVITARNREAIISARHRIQLLMESSKKNINYTHFLSIPLNKQGIIDNFNSFKTDTLEKYNWRNGKAEQYKIDESLFQTPSKLHLTIGMLKLLDDDEKKRAVNALTSCKKQVIEPIIEEAGPLFIQLKGVACMNDDPTEVKVLFAQVTHNEKLQELVDKVADYFVNAGIREKEYENVKLHVTLMNTSFKDYPGKFKDTFNADEVLKDHKNTLFGETILNQIDISELRTATKNDYYKSLASITF